MNDKLLVLLASLSGVKTIDLPDDWVTEDIASTLNRSPTENKKEICKLFGCGWRNNLATSLKHELTRRAIVRKRRQLMTVTSLYGRMNSDIETPSEHLATLAMTIEMEIKNDACGVNSD